MKTPEQIAEDVAREFAQIEWRGSSLAGPAKSSAYNATLSTARLAALAAVQADRAQRPAEPTPTAYKTLGNIAHEIRRMRADGVTVGSVEYAMSRVFAEEQN